MRKIIAHTVRGEISFYGVMADMEKEAGAGFYRCHRGYLVNLSYVMEYDMENIMLSNGEKIYLSKDRYHDFVKQYMRYLRNGVFPMYKAMEPFIEAAAYIVDGYCLCMLFGKFGERRIKRGIGISLLTILTWIAANAAIRYFVFSNPPYTLEKSLLSFILRAGAIYTIGLCFYKGRQAVYLFLTLLLLHCCMSSVRLDMVSGCF